MSNVIELNAHRPHRAGEAFCKACLYQWVSVAPEKVESLQCPSCSGLHGVFADENDGSMYAVADFILEKHAVTANSLVRAVMTDDIVQAMKQYASRPAPPAEGGE